MYFEDYFLWKIRRLMDYYVKNRIMVLQYHPCCNVCKINGAETIVLIFFAHFRLLTPR